MKKTVSAILLTGVFAAMPILVSVLLLCLVLMSRNGFLLLSGCVWALIIME